MTKISIIKSIALAACIAKPLSLAFTTSSSNSRYTTVTSTTPLYSTPSPEEERDWRRQRLRDGLSSSPQSSSSQEEQLSDMDFPSSYSSHSSESTDPSSSFFDDNTNNNNEPRSSEFHNLEPLSQSPTRMSRLEMEAKSMNIYTTSGSDHYWELKDEIAQLESDLATALNVGVSENAVNAIRDMLRKAQSRDPQHVYKLTQGAAWSAGKMGRVDESRRYMEESLRARKMLPQFNLEGLWVGKYGSHGFEMINVTYSGDTLVAYKVTGDANIPRGEISFTADLSPNNPNLPHGPTSLEPIQLSEASAKKWGTKRLPRFPGHGHAAEPGFINHQFMEGQLVVIGEGNYFSFAWVPLEHQIFFGRPSPELTLKMLREGGGSALTAGVGLEVPGLEADVRELTDYVSRCLEVTSDAFFDELNEGKVDPMSCIWHGDDEEYCYFE